MSERNPIYDSPNPHRLYRDPDRAVLWGVAAGFAEYFGMPLWKMRGIFAVLFVVFLPQMVIAYAAAVLILRPRPRPGPLYRDPDEERFWRAVSGRPSDTLGGLRHRFRELDGRLADMERTVTSDDYRLAREIEGLKR